MNFRNRGSVGVLCLLVAMPQGSAVASDCSQLVGDIQRETRAFHREAQQLSSSFLRDEALDGRLDAFRKRLDGLEVSDPVSAASKGFREAEDAGKKLQSWDERLKRWGAGISGYKNCMKNPGCSFADWLKEHEIINKEFADWLKSFGGEPLEKTTERVEKASELLKNYTGKVGSTATGAMASAAECMADYSPRSQSASSQEAVPVAQPPAKDAAPPKKGMSTGRVVGMVSALTLGALGVGLAASAAQVAEDGDTGGGGGMSYLDSQGIVCVYNAGGVLSSCSGNVLVNISNKIAVGSTIRLFGSFWGGNRATTTSPPGSINFFMTGGTGGTSCPGPLTSLALSNLSESTSTIIASVGGISIPVTCR